MGVKKLIEKITEFLNITNYEVIGKKRSLKDLLFKLKRNRVRVLKKLKKDLDIQEKKILKEELKLLTLHIKKAKKKLASL